MPFVIGISRTSVGELKKRGDSLEEVVIVDIDNNIIVRHKTQNVADDYSLLPAKNVAPILGVLTQLATKVKAERKKRRKQGNLLNNIILGMAGEPASSASGGDNEKLLSKVFIVLLIFYFLYLFIV